MRLWRPVTPLGLAQKRLPDSFTGQNTALAYRNESGSHKINFVHWSHGSNALLFGGMSSPIHKCGSRGLNETYKREVLRIVSVRRLEERCLYSWVSVELFFGYFAEEFYSSITKSYWNSLWNILWFLYLNLFRDSGYYCAQFIMWLGYRVHERANPHFFFF